MYYRPSKAAIERAIKWGCLGFYFIHPLDFLRLTTPNKKSLQEIFDRVGIKSLEYFNSPEYQDKGPIYPFIDITDTGKIIGHEGRHRAAAVYRQGNRQFSIAICPSYNFSYKSMPNQLISQYKGLKFVHELIPEKFSIIKANFDRIERN